MFLWKAAFWQVCSFRALPAVRPASSSNGSFLLSWFFLSPARSQGFVALRVPELCCEAARRPRGSLRGLEVCGWGVVCSRVGRRTAVPPQHWGHPAEHRPPGGLQGDAWWERRGRGGWRKGLWSPAPTRIDLVYRTAARIIAFGCANSSSPLRSSSLAPLSPPGAVTFSVSLSSCRGSAWLEARCPPSRSAAALAAGQERGHRAENRVRLGWHWLCGTRGKLLAASHRSHPCSPPLPKPCHANAIHRPSECAAPAAPHWPLPVWHSQKSHGLWLRCPELCGCSARSARSRSLPGASALHRQTPALGVAPTDTHHAHGTSRSTPGTRGKDSGNVRWSLPWRSFHGAPLGYARCVTGPYQRPPGSWAELLPSSATAGLPALRARAGRGARRATALCFAAEAVRSGSGPSAGRRRWLKSSWKVPRKTKRVPPLAAPAGRLRRGPRAGSRRRRFAAPRAVGCADSPGTGWQHGPGGDDGGGLQWAGPRGAWGNQGSAGSRPRAPRTGTAGNAGLGVRPLHSSARVLLCKSLRSSPPLPRGQRGARPPAPSRSASPGPAGRAAWAAAPRGASTLGD